jgi:hypothetical protein
LGFAVDLRAEKTLTTGLDTASLGASVARRALSPPRFGPGQKGIALVEDLLNPKVLGTGACVIEVKPLGADLFMGHAHAHALGFGG